MTVRLFILAVVAIMLAIAKPAHAGTFVVDMCPSLEHPAGGVTGWTQRGALPNFYYVDLSCNNGQFSVGANRTAANTPAGVATGWQFTIPAPMTVQSLDIDYIGDVTSWSGWAAQLWGRPRGSTSWLDALSCAGSPCPVAIRDLPMYGVGAIGFGVECGPGTCPAGSAASMEVQLLRLRLTDPVAPVVTHVAGSLTTPGPLRGRASISFHAVDSGAGVRSAVLEIDGHQVATSGFDTPSRSCAQPYSVVTPCPQSVDGTFSVDTLSLLDGPHEIRLLVRDATDQNIGIAGPWNVTTVNQTVASLCNAQVGASASLSLRPRHVVYGHGSALTLNWPANPWTNAEAVLFSGSNLLTALGTAARPTPTRFVAEVPPGPTRIIRLAIRPSGSRGAFACTNPIVVHVRARVSLKARPRHVLNGHRVRLAGRLAGGPAAGHRPVIIEARARGSRRHWVPVHVGKTGAAGRFRFVYRFQRTFQRTVFLFRARVPVSPGFPYSAGRSPIHKVVVQP